MAGGGRVHGSVRGRGARSRRDRQRPWARTGLAARGAGAHGGGVRAAQRPQAWCPPTRPIGHRGAASQPIPVVVHAYLTTPAFPLAQESSYTGASRGVVTSIANIAIEVTRPGPAAHAADADSTTDPAAEQYALHVLRRRRAAGPKTVVRQRQPRSPSRSAPLASRYMAGRLQAGPPSLAAPGRVDAPAPTRRRPWAVHPDLVREHCKRHDPRPRRPALGVRRRPRLAPGYLPAHRAVEPLPATTGRIELVHANDSRDEAGSGRDRHEHLAHGSIAPDALAETSAGVLHPPSSRQRQHRGHGADLAWLRERPSPSRPQDVTRSTP